MSEVKVNKISPRSGTTVTLGDSGDTFTIPSGATINNQGTATNFGATGSASWVTTVKTSSPFTAVAGEGYFVNTTGGAVTVNLPAGTAGAVVAIKDYAGTFDTNNCILSPNGSDKIGGDGTTDATLSVEGIAVTLVFIDSTQGWLVTDSGLQNEAPTAEYITATGGTPTTSPCGDYKIHTFTGPGAFCVSSAGNPGGSTTLEYMVIAGGGGGGANRGGGGGAGGFRFASPSLAPATYPAKPLAAPAGLTASVGSIPVTIGAAGTAGNPPTTNAGQGGNSTFSTIISTGGGRGDRANTGSGGAAGGSGGGGSDDGGAIGGGAGNTPPVSPPQGNSGGAANGPIGGGGGGGALAAGANGINPNGGGPGGVGGGFPNAFGTSGQNCGSFYYFSGGGAGGGKDSAPGVGGAGGVGGGGAGGTGAPGCGPQKAGTAGTDNTGGGGGGGGNNGGPCKGAAGGSGIVIIRYKFQN